MTSDKGTKILMEWLDKPPLKTRYPGHRAKNTIERRQYVLQQLQTIGILGIKRQRETIAQKFNVSSIQIYYDTQWCLKNAPTLSTEEMTVNLRLNIEQADQDLMQAIQQTTNPTTKAILWEKWTNITQKTTQIAESWGIKAKVADKHIIAGMIAQVTPEQLLRTIEQEHDKVQ